MENKTERYKNVGYGAKTTSLHVPFIQENRDAFTTILKSSYSNLWF